MSHRLLSRLDRLEPPSQRSISIIVTTGRDPAVIAAEVAAVEAQGLRPVLLNTGVPRRGDFNAYS